MRLYAYQSLHQSVVSILTKAGFPVAQASAMATTFLEADLMGYTTHGLQLLRLNIDWLNAGETKVDGDLRVLSDLPAVMVWDAGFLPGPYVMHRALDEAMARVKSQGMVSLVIKKSQHIACQAAYMPRLIEAGLCGMITCTTASEHKVSPHNGMKGVFSTNPFAMGAPASDGAPLIIDVSTSITAGGYVKRALRENKAMDRAVLKDKHGRATDDPTVMADGGSMQPVGGMDHGYKGFAFSLMSEVLTTGLSGYGRADGEGDKDGEANTVFVQIFDPEKFAGLDAFKRQTAALAQMMLGAGNADPQSPVRVPGHRAWALRQQQIADGVNLYPAVEKILNDLANEFGVDLTAR